MRRNCFERLLTVTLGRIGRYVARHRIIFFFAPIVVSVILGTAFFNITFETDVEFLYTPINGINRFNSRLVEKLFPNNYTSNFDPGRMTAFGQWAWIIVTCNDRGSVLRTSVLQRILEIDETTRNITIEDNGEVLGYRELCAKKDKKCFENSIIPVAKMVNKSLDGRRFLRYPIDLDLVHYRFTYYADNLGGVVTGKNNEVLDAKAIRLLYFVDDSDKKKRKLAERWQAKVVKDILDRTFADVEVNVFTTTSIDSEMQRIVESKYFLYSISVVFMVTFAVITTVNMDWVNSKPWTGVFASFSSGLALLSGFGICIYCGVPYIHINIATGFLMLGIGMDDSFVVLSAWRRTKKSRSVEERLGDTYSEAAVSITITSLTNLISFAIGVATPFPAIRIFCCYTAVAIFFTYMYQLLFVGACFAFCGVAEEKNLHSLTFLPIASKSSSEKHSKLYSFLCTAKRDSKEDGQVHFLMEFFRDQVGGFLSRKSAKIGVVFVFIIYLAFAIWGCTILKENNDIESFLPDQSYATDFFKKFKRYFNTYRDRVQVVINTPLDYSDAKVQEEIEELLQRYEASSYIGEPELTESWLRYFLLFLKDPKMGPIVTSFNMSSKSDFIVVLRRTFLLHPATKHFKDDIVFDDNYTEIIASRFLMQTNVTTSDYREKYMLQELRSIAENCPFSVLVLSPFFSIIDLVFVVVPTTVQTTSIAAAVMIVVCFMFIPNASCAMWVAISVVSIEIGVVGYMALWDVSLDATSMVILVMCIGFSVDYSAHISYSYIKAKYDSPDDKMKDALFSLGMAIFQAAVSTLIGVAFLSFVPSLLFLKLFKVLFLVILLASLHGVVFLPVFLSLTDEMLLKIHRGKVVITSDNGKQKNIPPKDKGPVILSKANPIEFYHISGQVNPAYVPD